MVHWVTVKYHSRKWAELVEQGWMTWTVDLNRQALMVWGPWHRRRV